MRLLNLLSLGLLGLTAAMPLASPNVDPEEIALVKRQAQRTSQAPDPKNLLPFEVTEFKYSGTANLFDVAFRVQNLNTKIFITCTTQSSVRSAGVWFNCDRTMTKFRVFLDINDFNGQTGKVTVEIFWKHIPYALTQSTDAIFTTYGYAIYDVQCVTGTQDITLPPIDSQGQALTTTQLTSIDNTPPPNGNPNTVPGTQPPGTQPPGTQPPGTQPPGTTTPQDMKTTTTTGNGAGGGTGNGAGGGTGNGAGGGTGNGGGRRRKSKRQTSTNTNAVDNTKPLPADQKTPNTQTPGTTKPDTTTQSPANQMTTEQTQKGNNDQLLATGQTQQGNNQQTTTGQGNNQQTTGQGDNQQTTTGQTQQGNNQQTTTGQGNNQQTTTGQTQQGNNQQTTTGQTQQGNNQLLANGQTGQTEQTGQTGQFNSQLPVAPPGLPPDSGLNPSVYFVKVTCNALGTVAIPVQDVIEGDTQEVPF